MRRIYPLSVGRTFDEVARALKDTELDLARVVSCTFPGRPEPREAEWTLPNGLPVIRYQYIPDTELRTLRVLSPDFSLFADGGPSSEAFEAFFVVQLGASPFDSFALLETDLIRGDYVASNRAAAAFRLAVVSGDDSVDGEQVLVSAVENGEGHGPVAAAAELADVATDRSQVAIERAYDLAEDVELRHHLRRARERLLSRV